jgi:hypothetical protein
MSIHKLLAPTHAGAGRSRPNPPLDHTYAEPDWSDPDN